MTVSRTPGFPPGGRSDIVAILAYPAQTPALTTLVALSLGMLLTPAPLVGFVVLLFVWAAVCRYAVEVLERSANGSSVAPEFAIEPDGMGWTLLILQALFLVCRLWLDYRVESNGLCWLGVGLIACVQPAMILTAAMSRDMRAAFDPARLLQVVEGLGITYALLIGATFVLGTLQLMVVTMNVLTPLSITLGTVLLFLGKMLADWVTTVFGQVLAGFVWFYAMVMYFHFLGRVVYSHRAAFDFTPVPLTVLRPEDRHEPLLQRVEFLAEAGESAAAAQELGRCLATERHASAAMHKRYRALLSGIGDHVSLQAHARDRLAQLIATGAGREALSLLRESLARDPQFRPASSELATRLAHIAERLGQIDLALVLLQDFVPRYPRDLEGAANALIAARLLLERRSDIEGARAVLQGAIDQFLPAHPAYAELVQRLVEVEQLSRRVHGAQPGTAPVDS